MPFEVSRPDGHYCRALIAAAIVSALAIAATPNPASAGTYEASQAASKKNKEKKRAHFQTFAVGDCGADNVCTLAMFNVPKRKRLEIERASCFINVRRSGGPRHVNITVFRGAAVAGVDYLPAQKNLGTAANSHYVAETATSLFAEAGQSVQIDAYANEEIDEFSCALFGEIVTLR